MSARFYNNKAGRNDLIIGPGARGGGGGESKIQMIHVKVESKQ